MKTNQTPGHVVRADFRLGPNERDDARRAMLLLDGTGLSLLQAAQLAIQRGQEAREVFPPVRFADAIREFIAAVHARGRRGATLDFYESKLDVFAASPLAAHWQKVTRGELTKWLAGLSFGASTRGMVFRAVRAFYRFAADHDPAWCGSPPTNGVTMPAATGDREIAFYRAEVVAPWLANCKASLRPALAAQLFAGFRPEEVAPRWEGKGRMSWEHFDFTAKIVRVPADVAKTRRARILEELPAALWLWLGEVPKAMRAGPLWAGRDAWLQWQLREALPKGVDWISRGPRKTFATHAVALAGDVGKVALWLGHEASPTMLHRHYRGLVTQADAKRYFGLRP